MPQVTIKKLGGGDAGQVALEPAVFEAEKNAVLVREVYNAYMSNQRQGTHATKGWADISGGGRKPWKQKGTGRARQGSIRAPQWRGGVIIHGPQPKSYREKVNKKKRVAAFRAVLSSKFELGELIVVDAIDLGATAKTKQVVALRDSLGAKGRVLIVTKDKNEALVRAAANLASSTQTPTRVEVVDALSIFDLLNCSAVILTKDALEALQERLK